MESTGRDIKGQSTASDKQMMAPERENPAERVRIRFPWRWVLGLLAVAAPVFPACLYLFRDEPPHDDSDLVVEEESVPPEENGWQILKDATERVYWPDFLPSRGGQSAYERAEAMRHGNSWDAELAEELLRRNEAALQLFDETRRFSAFVRTNGDDYAGDIHGSELMTLVKSVFIRAFLAEQRGRVEEAFEDAMNVLRLGRKMRRSANFIIRLYSRWCEEPGLSAVQQLLRRNGMCASHFKGYSGELLAGAFGPDDVATDIREGYVESLKFLREIETASAEPDPDGPYAHEVPVRSSWDLFQASMEARRVPFAWRRRTFYLPNQTRRIKAEAARTAIRNAARLVKDWEGFETPTHAREGLGGWLRLLPVRNGIGKFTIGGAFGEPHRLGMKSAVHLRVEALLTAAWIAVECHRQEQGNLPASLDELVPEYLSAVPLDPYDGEPLRYSADRRVIHSVGDDFVDSGGSTRPDWRYTVWDESEPTLRIDE